MAIQITLEDGHTETLTGNIRGITDIDNLKELFEGTCYLDGTWIESFVDKDNEDAQRITGAEWIDTNPETSFHGYVLAYMNKESIEIVFSIAEGNHPTYEMWDALRDDSDGFEQCVDKLIKSDGLDFLFGNGFSLQTLFELVVREIVRDYLREHDIADI